MRTALPVKDLRLGSICLSKEEWYCFSAAYSVASRNVGMNWDSISEGPSSCKTSQQDFNLLRKRNCFITGIFI